MKRTPTAALTLAAAALVLTGCGGVQKDATYENATDLREAVLSVGGQCIGEKELNNEEESMIVCGDQVALRVLPTEDDLSKATLLMILQKTSHLEGPNWIIQSEDAEELAMLRDELGGTVTMY
jgi:hypothetical protein